MLSLRALCAATALMAALHVGPADARQTTLVDPTKAVPAAVQTSTATTLANLTSVPRSYQAQSSDDVWVGVGGGLLISTRGG